MAIDWSAVEDALFAWVLAGSGLPANAIVWADQNGTRPTAPYIAMRLGEVLPVGVVDELTQTFDPAATPDPVTGIGREITFTTNGLRDFDINIQAFSFETTGNDTARVILYNVQNALSLPSVRSALQAAGLSPYNRGSVVNLAEKLGADFAGRASLEVHFYVNDSSSEQTTYIETVSADGTIDDIDLPVTVTD